MYNKYNKRLTKQKYRNIMDIEVEKGQSQTALSKTINNNK
jgi:hypothetical protein